MSQPTVSAYFASRKRSAIDDFPAHSAKKMIMNDGLPTEKQIGQPKVHATPIRKLQMTIEPTMETRKTPTRRIVRARKTKDQKSDKSQRDLLDVFANMTKNVDDTNEKQNNEIKNYPTTPTKPLFINPPLSTMEKIASADVNKLSLAQIKAKLTRSSRLAELKASLDRVNKMTKQIEDKEVKKAVQEKKTLKPFTTIEIEVPMSPSKLLRTPEKPYLSPVKKPTSIRKNLFGSPVKTPVSPVKSPSKLAAYQRFAHLTSPDKSELTLPFKYRSLAEIFRAIDEICAMLWKKQTITFTKLKSAVQERLRRNLTEKHLAQIHNVYPEAFNFHQEKIRLFGACLNDEKYDLVLLPNVSDGMTLPVLLERRRNLYKRLLDKVKGYHDEFLNALDPPIRIEPANVLRWHPEFNLEQVPDVDETPLPKAPDCDKVTSAKEMLARAKNLFNCNTKMELALQRLAEKQAQSSSVVQNDEIKTETKCVDESKLPETVLKGIPKALLDKVRARQAAKALDAMTRDPVREKQAAQMAQLPDLTKFLRNIFITERKNVLPMDMIINKLNNSFRTNLRATECEELLTLLAKTVPECISLCEVRKTMFVKLNKSADMASVLKKLEEKVDG